MSLDKMIFAILAVNVSLTVNFKLTSFFDIYNNNLDYIYSAVIMTVVIARVHSVHLVNVQQRQAAARRPSYQTT